MNKQIITNKKALQEQEEDWNETLCPYHCNKQCGKFPIGSIVYWVSKKTKDTNYKYVVEFGRVIAHYKGEVECQLYEMYDGRTINGIPIKEFETPTKWQKLPKGWDYNTQLFTIEYNHKKYDTTHQEDLNLNIKNPQDILKAIEYGILVKVQENDHSVIIDEIDDKKGWRIIREYKERNYRPTYKTIRFHQVYATYDEAQQIINNIETEWKRQSELSYYDWSVEQIDDTLDKWAAIYNHSEEEKQLYRNWILELDGIENVEVRIFGKGLLQWKYAKNKRWSTIELSV